MRISDIAPGQTIAGYYLLKQATLRTTTGGKPYLSGILADRSGQVELKVWDYAGPIGTADEGKVVALTGRVSDFRGTLQVTSDRIRLATPQDDYKLSELVPTAPIDLNRTLAEIEQMLGNMVDKDYQAVCRAMLTRHREAFAVIPAAKSVHHSFRSGLIMHTSYMMKTALYLAKLYGDMLDVDLLLAGTFLHDFAKIREFDLSDSGLVSDYSLPGQLLGHLVMGAEEAAQVCAELHLPEEKAILLQHLILSHHGQPEFGAAVPCQCAEAELLSYIDLIDSRMEIYREALEKTEPGTFSERVFALDNKRLYRHK